MSCTASAEVPIAWTPEATRRPVWSIRNELASWSRENQPLSHLILAVTVISLLMAYPELELDEELYMSVGTVCVAHISQENCVQTSLSLALSLDETRKNLPGCAVKDEEVRASSTLSLARTSSTASHLSPWIPLPVSPMLLTT